MRCDRVIDLPVIEHLCPDLVVDDSADMFPKLAIDVIRNRSACFRLIDLHADWLLLGKRDSREEEQGI